MFYREQKKDFEVKEVFLYGFAVFNGETHNLASLMLETYPAATPIGSNNHLCRAARSLPGYSQVLDSSTFGETSPCEFFEVSQRADFQQVLQVGPQSLLCLHQDEAVSL